MTGNVTILKGLMMLIVLLIISSCEDNNSASDNTEKDASLLLTIRTGIVGNTRAASADDLAKGGDSWFSDLAIYIFNESDGYCEYAELVPGMTQAVDEYYRSVEVSSQTKIVYAIANYDGNDKSLSLPLSTTATMQQLEDLTVANTGEFNDSSIMMIGKQRVEISGTYVQAEISMERLAARVDVYLFKNNELANDSVKITGVELLNQITNSNCIYNSTDMLSPVLKQNIQGVISQNPSLRQMTEDDVSKLVPDNAHSSFYSYQNIVSSGTLPDSSAYTPYLRITVEINARKYVYGAYLTDAGQNQNKYSLMRNTVYRVIAMVSKPDNELDLQITANPWNVSQIQSGGIIVESDYSLDALGGNDSGALTGIVQYPYILNSVPYDATSYANYSFKLTGPVGKVWVASMSNGLDFNFASLTSASGKLTVSHGISRNEPYQITVGAAKSWGGADRATYMYITVDGVKLKINPLQSGGSRKFPGNNDTDILITQTQYQ